MLFCSASDLHIDFYKLGVLSVDLVNGPNPGSEVLVVAGDTANHYEKMLRFLKRAAERYSHVVVTDGNHEHYNTGRTVAQNVSAMIYKCKLLSNVTFLDRHAFYRHGDTVFLGLNGWYDFNHPDYPEEAQREAF